MTHLNHIVKQLPFGQILVLDRGSVISAEAEAMLQAMYSRSPASVNKHLEVVQAKGAAGFMSTYYVEYGHKSIGDCGDATLFIEGVSMLAAKAIQDSKLYAGQEVSTRYVDFSTQKFINLDDVEGSHIQEKMRTFYVNTLPKVEESLAVKNPIQEGEKEIVWKKAIKARAFDILRGFLPAGASTSVAWHGNLRQIADHIAVLRHHPLEEVRTVAEVTLGALIETYPSSFSHKQYPATEEYVAAYMKEVYYYEASNIGNGGVVTLLAADKKRLAALSRFLKDRPIKTELPKFIEEVSQVRWELDLDFGSFRDLQRHRAPDQLMPRLTIDLGFENWYLSELPEDVQKEAKSLLSEVEDFVKKTKERLGKDNLQYFIPMGYKVSVRMVGGLHSLTYLAELRATHFVHPTLQKQAVILGKSLERCFAEYGYKIYLSEEVGRFDVRRGSQDIVER